MLRDRTSIDLNHVSLVVLLALARFDKRFLLQYLVDHPYLKDMLLGVGAAFDPYPKCYNRTFITDDHLALLEDWLAVGDDFRTAMKKADDKYSAVVRSASRGKKPV